MVILDATCCGMCWELRVEYLYKIYDNYLIQEYLKHIQKLSEKRNDSYIVNNLINKIYVRRVNRKWFDGGFRIFYKIDWNFLGKIDIKLKMVVFILLSNLFQTNNLLYSLDSKTNKDNLYKRYLKLVIEFYIDRFKLVIVDCYLEYVDIN